MVTKRKKTTKHTTTHTAKKASRPASASKSNPLEAVGQVAIKGVYLGLGTAAMVAENAEQFAKRAIERGEKIQVLENLDKLASVSKKQVDHVKSLIQRRRATRSSSGLEAKLEAEITKAIDRIQAPLKRNIEDLSKKLTSLAQQVSKMVSAAK